MKDRKIGLYLRVSTDMQRERGESLETQKSRLIEYSKQNGHSYKIYEDPGFSAGDTNRPALKSLINEIKEDKISIVLVTKVDRITRRLRDLIELLELFEKYNVGFKSLTQPIDTSSSMGRGFLNMLGVFAEMERGMVSERVGEDMRHRAKNGKFNGGVNPFGYTSYALELKKLLRSGLSKERAESQANKITPELKRLYINPEEAEVVKKIYKKYIELESLRGVTHWLNKNGYKTRNDKTWATATISRILSNPTYTGKIWYNKRASSKTTKRLKNRPKEEWIISKGSHRPIIDEKAFDTVKNILERQSKEPRRKMSEYLLSGLVRCGKCGGTLNGYTQRRITPKSPRIYSYYKCHTNQSKGKSVCSGNSIAKKTLENIVIENILSLNKSKEFKVNIKRALKEFNKEVSGRVKPVRQERDSLVGKNDKISTKKKNLLIYLEDGTIDKGIYKERISELDKEFEKNQQRIFEIESQLNDTEIESISFNSVYESIKNFSANWEYYDIISKKDLLWSLVSKIVINEKEIKIDLFFLPSLFSNFSNERLPLRVLWA